MRAFVGVVASCALVHTAMAAHQHMVHGYKNVDRFHMMRHSFVAPLTFDNQAEMWTLEGATIPANEHVVLVPAVADRVGHLWHKEPVETSNFEVEFEFQVKGPEVSKSHGFAFWYSNEDFASTYTGSEEQRAEWDLFGYKGRFDGVGVFFANYEKDGRFAPSISVGLSNGHQDFYRHEHNVPTEFGREIPFRNSEEPMKFRFAVNTVGVQGFLQVSPSQNSPWQLVFSVDAALKTGGYIGFSAASAAADVEQVAIRNVHVYNLDMTVTGEKVELPPAVATQAEELLATPAPHTMKAATAAIIKVTELLAAHVEATAPKEDEVFAQLNTLQHQLALAAQSIRVLRQEVASSRAEGTGDAAASLQQSVSLMKAEMDWMKSTVQRTMARSSDLSAAVERKMIQDAANDRAAVEALNARAASLQSAVKTHQQRSQLMLVVCALAVLGFALNMWRRMVHMEKKHLL